MLILSTLIASEVVVEAFKIPLKKKKSDILYYVGLSPFFLLDFTDHDLVY